MLTIRLLVVAVTSVATRFLRGILDDHLSEAIPTQICTDLYDQIPEGVAVGNVF